MFRELWPEAARLQDLVTEPFEPEDVERLRKLLREIEVILARRAEAVGSAP